MTHEQAHAPARYSYFVRLWNMDSSDEADLEYRDTVEEAAADVDALEDEDFDGTVTVNGIAFEHWDIVKIDWHWHEATVIDGGDF